MALKTFVLISSVNNLSDARYCAGMDVDLIGFSMEAGNKNYISPEVYKELTEWLSGVEFVGEFENSTLDDIQSTLETYNTSYVQIQQPELVVPLQKAGFTVILRQPIDALDDTITPDYLVVEGGNDVINDAQKEKIRELNTAKILLGYGITEQNAEELIEATGAHGVALRGGDEIRPGYKDYDELADILEALEIDDLA